MSDLDEIRSRVDGLEAEVARLREEAAATRTLAALADRDASEVRVGLRAHTQALSALRETQVEHGRTLDTLAEAVGGLVTGQHALTETVGHLTETVGDLTETVGSLTKTVGDLAAGQRSLAGVQQRHGEDLAEIKALLRGLADRG